MMKTQDYQERYEEAAIQERMRKEGIDHLHAWQEFEAWKRQNRDEYRRQFDNYIDDVNYGGY